MQARILYGRCRLCECPDLADAAKADCSGHPLYHPALGRLVQWKRCNACGHVFTEGRALTRSNAEQPIGCSQLAATPLL
jgi:hypothetical protein